MMTNEGNRNLRFAWIGDFDSLNYFVKDNLMLDGTWLQSGGDNKLFTSDHVTTTWKKNKNVLSLDGERAIDIMKELCKQII